MLCLVTFCSDRFQLLLPGDANKFLGLVHATTCVLDPFPSCLIAAHVENAGPFANGAGKSFRVWGLDICYLKISRFAGGKPTIIPHSYWIVGQNCSLYLSMLVDFWDDRSTQALLGEMFSVWFWRLVLVADLDPGVGGRDMTLSISLNSWSWRKWFVVLVLPSGREIIDPLLVCAHAHTYQKDVLLG